jgi:hypothetical protein
VPTPKGDTTPIPVTTTRRLDLRAVVKDRLILKNGMDIATRKALPTVIMQITILIHHSHLNVEI